MAKTMIVFYSWSDRTKELANKIKKLLPNADLLELRVPAGTFTQDTQETSEIAKTQLKEGNLPGFSEFLPDFSSYDNLLVGGPVWSFQPSTPILHFLDTLKDYQGTVAPFYTSVGQNGDYEAIFKARNPQLKVVAGNDNGKDLEAWVKQFK